MNRIQQSIGVVECSEQDRPFVTSSFRHTARRTTRGKSIARRRLDHRGYVKAQVRAAKLEAAWTPRTTE